MKRDALAAMRDRLREQQETLDAIRSGQVDGLIVTDPKTHGEKLFTLQGADFAFRTMLEQMGEGAASASPDGTVLYCNRTFARLCGRPMRRVSGSGLLELVAPGAAKEVAKALRAGARRTVRLEAELAGGIPSLLTLSPLSGYEPPAVGIVATDLRLRAKNAELERRVRERTSALQAANRELQAFNYSVSHDLKAPARQITLFSQVLERQYAAALGPDGARLLARIKQSAERLSALINGMLELSRATLSDVEYKNVDLTAMARAVAAKLRRAEPGHPVKIHIARGMTLRGDEGLLRLALHNLLSNAWKFTAGRRNPRVDVSYEDAAKGIVRVRDNGAGFDMSHSEKLFQPFQRLHRPREFPGTGIGLSIVQRVLTRQGGRVWGKGVPGRGATFYFQVGAPGGRPR